MKISIRRRWMALTGAVLLVFAFQNCSKMKFTQLASTNLDGSGFDGGYGSGGDGSGADPGYIFNRDLSLPIAGSVTSNPVKMLIVVDNSWTMSQSKSYLAKRINELVKQIAGRNVEVGVTTTNYNYGSATGTSKTYVNGVEIDTKTFDSADYVGKTLTYITEALPPRLNGTFKFTSTMSSTEILALSLQLEKLIENIPLDMSQIQYERSLCVVSHYLADTTANAFIKSQDKVGVVIISDEDDYSGLQNEKCKLREEMTYGINNMRTYYGKFLPIVPAGSFWAATYNYNTIVPARSEPIYRDGILVGTNQIPEKIESRSNIYQFAVKETGHTFGETCSAADLQRTLDYLKSVLPTYDAGTVSIAKCRIDPPGSFDIELGTFYGPLAENDLCQKSFVSNGVTYQNVIDYFKRYVSPNSHYLVDETSCRAGEKKAQYDPNTVTRKTIPVIPENSDFGPAIANMSKTRFNNSVYISSIVHVPGESCQLDQGQSLGLQFVKLSTSMGDHANATSICNSDYTEPILKLATQTLTLQKQFSVPLMANERVIKVTVIKVSGARVVLPAAEYGFANGVLTVNSNALEVGGTVVASIGVK